MSYWPHVETLYLYPVKGFQAVCLREAQITERGLLSDGVRDRAMMLIDDSGKFITQREMPQLAKFQTGIKDGVVSISMDGSSPIYISPNDTGATITVNIWGNNVPAHLTHSAHDRWLSNNLDRSVRLVRQSKEDLRFCDETYAARPGQDKVGFADGFPYLVANSATLNALNERLSTPLPIARFRPNIVIAGLAPDEEYATREIEFGKVKLSLVKPCTRCGVTAIDQKTGEKTRNEHFPILRQRHFIFLEPEGGKRELGVVFGMNAVPLITGKVTVGAAVRPTARVQAWPLTNATAPRQS